MRRHLSTGFYKLWPWLPPTRGDVLGACLGVFVFGALLSLYIWKPFTGRPLDYLVSDPGWTCTYPADGEPVCVKDVKPAP